MADFLERQLTVTVLLCLCVTIVTLAQNSNGLLLTSEVTIVPTASVASVGSTVTLNCTIPRNASARWYHNDTPLQTSTQLLTLREVAIVDAGIYKCCAKDCDSSNIAVASVAVGYPPRKPYNLRCECRDFININCSWDMQSEGDAGANVTLQIQDFEIGGWLDVPCIKRNPSLQDTHQYCFFNPNTFEYTNPQYNYRVLAKNKFAEVPSEHRDFHESFDAVPYPPDEITLQAASSTSLSVTWCAPSSWPPSQVRSLFFRVEYKAEAEDTWIKKDGYKTLTRVGDKQCKTLQLVGLKFYTRYCTRISSRKSGALYSNKYSEPSEPVCEQTLEDAPGPPFDVKVVVTQSKDKDTRAANITWQPVQPENRNGIILGYCIILYGTHFNDPSNTTTFEYNVTGDVTNLPVHGLDNYRTYSITIQAFNSAGMSWKKASPDGPIPAIIPGDKDPSPVAAAVIVPIVVVCLAAVFYCVWHRGKKILKPTYDIQIPQSARNDNLYVSTVNFRLQETECFDELKAPPTGDLHVSLPPNGVCSYGNGTCPAGDDFHEDICTPGLPSSENFPLLSGHNGNQANGGALQGPSKMLTVDCGENKALLDGPPYNDVGYNQTGSPLSVASGGSYWTTGGDENESVSYHRMSPKGLALCETDDQWENGTIGGRTSSTGACGGAIAEPSSPNSDISATSDRDTQRSAAPNGASSLDLPKSPTSPTSPVALYTVQASVFGTASAPYPHEEDPVGSSEEEDENNISCYVQQTQASSLGLLVPAMPASNLTTQSQNSKEKKAEGPCHPSKGGAEGSTSRQPVQKNVEAAEERENDNESVNSEGSDCLESYVLTANAMSLSPFQSNVTGTPIAPSVKGAANADNYVTEGGSKKNTAMDRNRPTLPVRSASSGDLKRSPAYNTPHCLPEDDSDSMISMEDADLQYVQAGRLTNWAPSRDPSPPSSPVSNLDYSQSAMLPGVAIDFPSDGSGGDLPQNNATVDNIRLDPERSSQNAASDYSLSDVDDGIDGYCTHAQVGFHTSPTLEQNEGLQSAQHPILPYVAIDMVPVQSPVEEKAAVEVPETSSPVRQVAMPLPSCATDVDGYVSQTHAMGLMMTDTQQEETPSKKEEIPSKTAPPPLEKKNSCDNPKYGDLANCLNSQSCQQNGASHRPQGNADGGIKAPSDQDKENKMAAADDVRVKSDSLEDIAMNNNSVYLPHRKIAMFQPSAPSDDSGYLPHGKIPTTHTFPPEKTKVDDGGVYVPHTQCLPEVKGGTTEVKGHKGYIPI